MSLGSSNSGRWVYQDGLWRMVSPARTADDPRRAETSAGPEPPDLQQPTDSAMKLLPTTLVIAATGKTGRRVADRLEAQGRPVRRASRSSMTAFDWDDRSTWGPALRGVQVAYVVYTPDLAVPAAPDAISAFTELARQEGVRRLVLLSGRGEPEAQRCERIVQASGLEWTVVRASWFAQNFDEGVFLGPVLSGEVALPVGDVREPFVDVEDVADVVTAALTEDHHAGQVYEVTGPRLLTFAQAVGEIARAAGREIQYVTTSDAAFLSGLERAGMLAGQIELLRYLFGSVLDGRNAHMADGVERSLSRPAKDFRDYARTAAMGGAWTPNPTRA